jgi:hypothetical protein
MKELDKYMKLSYDDFVEQEVLKAVDFLKHNPEAIEVLKIAAPFNDPKLKDVDWTKVKEASVKDGVLKLQF